ncbi:NAD(P)-binding protein [Hypoxylon trugodes]|uniref:NAD(P)-binding protein n=1 Tax=Hypoxylon trugodes TaxID=326681 RepID=UPI002196A25B|nr:NAD(P)-binding protein [Hypoxylon trugodes]KAI1391898.1 NAD(P)-binding protein [Hypoxylon trugodes]
MATKLKLPSNPLIAPGATILITGANGLIASHVVDQFLAAGYKVRGTVRDPAKCEWMTSLFAARHPSSQLELIEIADFAAPGNWNQAVKGVAGVASIAGSVGLDVQDIGAALDKELPWLEVLLQAAKDEPSVKAFIYTSSGMAAWKADPKKKVKLGYDSYNEDAIRIGLGNGSPSEKGIFPYMGFKAVLEQKLWDWVKRENPSYTFNTILPNTVCGQCLDPKGQGIPSTNAFVKALFDGQSLDVLKYLVPQWQSDTRDLGALYVAALITPGVDRERLYAFSDRHSWPRVAQILKELYPQRNIPILEDDGWDQTDVPNQRGRDLLRGLGLKGWTTLEESVKACAESCLELEG